MPRRRPIEFLRRLGRRIRSRRKMVKRSREIVANAVEISVQQLYLYEAGQAHPPAATLYRIAQALGTSSSALLGEHETDESNDALTRLYADPTIGAVTRYMEAMTLENRKTLQVIAQALAARHKPADEIEPMT